jgi:hypothetical protein
MLKLYLLLIALVFSFVSFSQRNNYSQMSHIDFLVQETDSLAIKSQKTFHLNKYIGTDRTYKETWHYTERNGKVAVFEIRYMLDLTEYMEVYYLDGNRLILSEEYETSFAADDEELRWGGIFYFVNNDITQVATLGRKKSYNRNWDFETEILSRFQKRYTELKRHIW